MENTNLPFCLLDLSVPVPLFSFDFSSSIVLLLVLDLLFFDFLCLLFSFDLCSVLLTIFDLECLVLSVDVSDRECVRFPLEEDNI